MVKEEGRKQREKEKITIKGEGERKRKVVELEGAHNEFAG